MGYNLAIEYLADPEKTWMLESFKQLDNRVLQPQHRALKEWLFLTVSPLPPPPRRPPASPASPALHSPLLVALPIGAFPPLPS